MSRIGNRILSLPSNVTLSTSDNVVTVKGPKGELSTEIKSGITVKVEGNEVTLSRDNDSLKQFHGTANANIKNMIIGVSDGFQKELETIGVGYRFTLKGNQLVVTAGYSHPVEVEIPAGLELSCPSNTELTIKGIDKQKVGQFAAEIRKIREPEPYKGKGIRYKGERVRRKEGKKASK
ncbi:MAG: 50S ribosomal protein L6 [Clostridium sp.]|nr:50S ribosomal protein L6 [Clostridium sp.]MCM1443819.1 50S ribosomal protein L6 [Candidatus Amulumruptor caecigallinarius]